MRFALVGYGKMGRAIEKQAVGRDHECALVVRNAREFAAANWERIDVAFEFTTPGSAAGNLLGLVQAGVRVVCGTTGWESDARLTQALAATPTALVVASNFSLGVQLYFRIVRHAADLIGRLGLHQPYVEEAHHRGKRDVPSGTGRRLAAILLEADPRLERVHQGPVEGVLDDGVLQVVSTRVGHEPGRHTVGFDGQQDRIVLRHESRSRRGFALGAVLAAEWIQNKQGIQRFEQMVDDLLEAAPAGGIE